MKNKENKGEEIPSVEEQLKMSLEDLKAGRVYEYKKGCFLDRE